MDTDEGLPIPVVTGSIAGVCAWLLGYAVTYAAGRDAVASDLRMQLLSLFAERPPVWQVVGWLYYNAHAVDLRVPPVGPMPASRPNYVLSEASLQSFFLLPPALLTLAGGAVAWRYRDELARGSDAAVAGATVVVGYFVVTVAGLVAFAASVGGATIRPIPVVAVVLAGVLYPVVFGAAGGLVAGYLARSA